MKLLGLSGKKSSGKSTSANFLVGAEMVSLNLISHFRIDTKGRLVVPAEEDGKVEDGIFDLNSSNVKQYLAEFVDPYCKVYSYADDLKYMAINMFGLTHEQCYGSNDEKNSNTQYTWEDLPTYVNNTAYNALPSRQKNTFYSLNRIPFNKYKPKNIVTAREFLQYLGTLMRSMNLDCWVNSTMRRIQREQPLLAIIADIRYPNEVDGIHSLGGKVIRFTRSPHEDAHDSESQLNDYEGFDDICDNANMTIGEQNEYVYNKCKEWDFLNYELEYKS